MLIDKIFVCSFPSCSRLKLIKRDGERVERHLQPHLQADRWVRLDYHNEARGTDDVFFFCGEHFQQLELQRERAMDHLTQCIELVHG